MEYQAETKCAKSRYEYFTSSHENQGAYTNRQRGVNVIVDYFFRWQVLIGELEWLARTEGACCCTDSE